MRERMLFLSARNQCNEEAELRTESFLEILLEKFDIDLLEYCSCERGGIADSRPALTVHRVGRAAGPRRLLLRPLNRLRPKAHVEDAGKDLRTEIRELCSHHAYSHVFVSHRLLGNCIDLIVSLLPEAVIITDAEHAWSSGGENEGPVRRKLRHHYHRINEARVRREERRLMNKTGLLLTATEWDALLFKSLSFADAGKVHVVPPFVDLQDYQYAGSVSRENRVMLHWAMNTVHGKNAAIVFHEKVYPLIQAEVPDVECCIVGSAVHPEVLALSKADPSVKIIEDYRLAKEYIRSSKAVIAYLREGCEGRKKILEAWALRTPVVTSLRGAEELICENGRNILLAGTAGGIAEHVTRLLQIPELGSLIADQAYRTLLNHYEASNVKAKVLSLV
ncbi:glycosyltransferase [Paenibacillus sp. S150]|uniref:glycosyltransferase n=1 Tax=Paenibacillus sp. S150 TaxID=2749826 RepID=UPI001C57DAA7|nr:glycosyltransferase [Paenibacillus sp. S150]MBW4084724.1 glycosyltransferase [Paenibacillus sp. S150]